MIVRYFCPLCLDELKPGRDQLLRFCRVHPDQTRCVEIDPHDMSGIFCPGDHLSSSCNLGKVDYGPLLLHVGCKQSNPFWDETKTVVEVPPAVQYEMAGAANTSTATLKHWLLDAMREVPEVFRINRAMWFPQALFRAFHEQETTRGLASTVLLLGGQAAGKSVLATMALRPETWRGALPGGGFLDTSGYVYVSPRAAGREKETDFVDSLAALVRGSGELIEETYNNERNIRGLFLKYEPDSQNRFASELPVSGGLQLFGRANVARAYKSFARAAGILWGRAPSRSETNHNITIPPPLPAVIFYDLKGETVDIATGALLGLIQNLQRIAVVMSAADLSIFGGQATSTQITQRRNSGDVAIQMLERVDGFNKPVSLVVTHIDQVREMPNPPEWAEYWKPHNKTPRAYRPEGPMSEQEIFCRAVQHGNDNERAIATLLKRRKWPVHFVWTENVDTANRYTVGIHNFVAEWCFPGLKTANASASGR